MTTESQALRKAARELITRADGLMKQADWLDQWKSQQPPCCLTEFYRRERYETHE